MAVHAAPLLRQPTASRDRIAFIHAGDLWTASRAGGLAVRLTQTPEPESNPRFSPDGRQIAFTRDGDVWVIGSTGGGEKRLTWHPAPDQCLGWTPDGRHLLLQSSRLRGDFGAHPHLFLLAPDGGWPEPLPIPRASLASYSPDGRQLAYSPTPEMVLWSPWRHYRGGSLGRIVLYDPAKATVRNLPATGANDVYPMWHGNGIYFASDRAGVMNLYRYDLASRQTRRLTNHTDWDVRHPSLGPDSIVYENGGALWELTLKDHRTRPVPIDLPAEPAQTETWIKALDEAWAAYRDHAFAPPAGWDQVKPRYQDLIRRAAHAADAQDVLEQMLAEAGQSHITLEQVGGPGAPRAGLLGADFRLAADAYQVTRVLGARSPLAGKVEPGEYLLAVNGHPLDPRQDLHAALIALAGKETLLTVNRQPTLNGARQVKVTPIRDERGLRWADWVQRNAARVAEATAGKVGYVHVPNVDASAVEDFREQWLALRGKVEAVIIDIRNNAGGIQPEGIWDLIARRPVKLMYDRHGRVPPFIGPYLDVPKLMLINEQCASGGDELALYFQREKLGPLIGTRTMGAMIGQGQEFPIAGRWVLGIPQYAFYWLSPDAWGPENRGVEPDYRVDLLPLPLTADRDPQLEKAIELAQTARKTWRRQIPIPPAFPAGKVYSKVEPLR